MDESSLAIDAQGVVKRFGDVTALGGFDMRVWNHADPWLDWIVPSATVILIAALADRLVSLLPDGVVEAAYAVQALAWRCERARSRHTSAARRAHLRSRQGALLNRRALNPRRV